MIFDSSFTTTSVLCHDRAGVGMMARGGWRTISADIQLVRGDHALALLSDPEFEHAWSELAEACSWATPWQSFSHAQVWFSVYGETFEPLLVFQREPSGELAGLLALAVERATGAIVHVGAHQAEYQVWLATEANGNLFIEEALRVLTRHHPGRRLKFQYLPPGAPIDWCRGSRWRGPRAILRRRWRPLLSLGPQSRIEESLKKKSNKSRINRLRRIGPVALIEMRTSEELARHFETIADFCDFRQGAINASLPFRDDPRKRELWLRLMDKPGLVHASALVVGGDVVAAHIGPIDGTTVSLGIIAHSPFVAEHSPGKVLMLLLARELGRQGYENFDLTPDGAYKERFADHTDLVHTLTVYFGPIGYAVDAGKNNLRVAALRVLGPDVRAFAKRAGQNLRRSLYRFGILVAPIFRRWAAAGKKVSYHSISANAVSPTGSPGEFSVNCVADLLHFKANGSRSKMQFLAAALKRIEAGDQVYTLSRNSVLLHCAWISFLPQSNDLGLPKGFECAPDSCLLWDDFTHPAADTPDLHKRSMAQRLQDAAASPAVQTILIRTDGHGTLPDTGMETSQFRHHQMTGR